MAKKVKVQRTLSQKLAMYLLYTEVGVVFFLTLTVYGLGSLSPAWAFGGGAVFAFLLIIAARYSYTNWGFILGWMLQFVFVAAGFLNEMMFIIGAIFLGMWIFTMVKAKQIENQYAAPEEQ